MQFIITTTRFGKSTTRTVTAEELERDETVASILQEAQHGSITITAA